MALALDDYIAPIALHHEQAEQQADGANDHQDQSDRSERDVLDLVIDRKAEDGANSNEKK